MNKLERKMLKQFIKDNANTSPTAKLINDCFYCCSDVNSIIIMLGGRTIWASVVIDKMCDHLEIKGYSLDKTEVKLLNKKWIKALELLELLNLR